MRLLIIFMLAAASLPAQNLKFKVKQLPKDTSVGRVVLSSLTDSTMTYSDLLKIDNDSLYFNGSGVLTSAMDVGGGTTYNNISETVDTVFIDDRLDIYNPNRTPQLTLSGPRSRFFMINDNGAGDYSQLLFGESETKYADMIWYNDDDKFQIFSYGDIEFSTQYVAPNIIPNLWIDADDGNVGIGTSSPSQKLTLSGPLSRMDFALRDVGSISTQNIFVYDQNSYDNDLDTVDARFAFYLANPNSTNYTGSNDDGPYFYMRGNGSAAERGHIAFVAGNVTNPTGADGRIDFATGSSTKMTIAANGNVGIGTASPIYDLEVYSDALLAEGGYNFIGVVNDAGGGDYVSGIGVYNGSGYGEGFLRLQRGGNDFYFWTDSNGDFRLSQTEAHIGSTNGTVVGTQTSDERLKYDIKDINYGIKEVMKLRPVSFKYKTDLDNKNKIGFIAQETVSIIPESVYDTDMVIIDGEPTQLNMEYVGIIPVLTKAIQEQQAIIENLQAQIDELKKLINK